MSTVYTELTEYTFFRGSISGVSSRVGWDTGVIRALRYKFRSPASGASTFTLEKGAVGLADGSAFDLRFFVTTDPNLCDTLGDHYAATGWVLTKTASGGYYTFTGSTEELILLPDTDYYLYIFPGSYSNGSMYSWNYVTSITVTLDGAAGVVRIREGNQELIALPIVKEGDQFIELAATIKTGAGFVFGV